MKVPFLDLDRQHQAIRPEIDEAVAAVIDHSAFSSGPFVSRFEEDFASYLGVDHVVAVNSGTAALHLALLAAGVMPRDEVVTTPHTWISTSWAISYCGATPVFADVDAHTGNLSPEAVETAITSRTKAILPVDLYGNPADHTAFEEIADRHGLPLICDAAQSHGATLRDRRVGQFGLATCFSFYPGKNLGAIGEGGAIATDNGEVAERIRILRDHAQDGRHHHVDLGFNARMDGIQGAVLSVKLRHLKDWHCQRQKAAQEYLELLGAIPQISPPEITQKGTSSWHLFPIRVSDRDSLAAELERRGVGVGIHYPTPVHLQPAYRRLGYGATSFPNAEDYAARCISLPIFPGITREQQTYVVSAIEEALTQ